MSADFEKYFQEHRQEMLDRLFGFLKFRSISADPDYLPEMEACREFLMTWLKSIGMESVRLLDGGGHPAVYAESVRHRDRPTIIVYGHYDVQPPDPIELWKSDPFDPTLTDDRIYARGASDVKGSTSVAIEVVAAYIALEDECPINVKFLIEGEEETGSPSLGSIVERYSDILRADAVLSADGGRVTADLPTINVGARGIAKLDFHLKTADKDLHSGRYGGAVRNALHEIVRILASLHDPNGRVAVPGFLESVADVSEDERIEASRLPFDEDEFVSAVGALPHGEKEYSLRERLTLRPTIEVNGVWGGYQGPGMKTIVPCEASAKLTMRLAAGQDPDYAQEVVRNHLINQCPEGASITFSSMDKGSPASALDPKHPIVAGPAHVIEKEYGSDVIPVRLGATVPITSIFSEKLGIETLLFGFNLPDEDIHAPNEFYRLSSIEDGFRVWSKVFKELSRFNPEQFHKR